MNPDRRTLLGGAMIASALVGAATQASGQASTPAAGMDIIPIWPKDPPGGEKVTVTESIIDRPAAGGLRDRAIEHTRKPTLAVFRPAKPNGAAMLIFPGGGYVRAVMDKEGYETAQWLAQRGYTCFVASYRMPGDGWAAGPDTPLQDAQRALRLVRSKAADMGFASNRIGVQGFSAGGHLVASLLTHFDQKVYEPIDSVDSLSARPDIGCLMYPVISFTPDLMHEGSRRQMIGAAPTADQINAYSPQLHVTSATPPTLLCHAADDGAVPVGNSIAFFTALKAAKVASEMHVFEEGGHGFGLRGIAEKPVGAWPELFRAWAAKKGV